jgi:hypothetical protein
MVMRKFVALFLAVSLSVAVVGCGEAKKETPKASGAPAASSAASSGAAGASAAAPATK